MGSEAQNDGVFDCSAEPPFTMADVRAAIPKHCWVKDTWLSISFVIRDFLAVFGLAAVAIYVDSFLLWPLYWFVQGTFFWGIFVLGHDCGHRSFSDSTFVCDLWGHILHSFVLVPYHGWRISHRTHHQNHGNVENDESWVPLTETQYKHLPESTRRLRFTLPYPLLAFPLYLWYRSPGKEGSHYNPYSPLFPPNERKNIVTSTIWWCAMVAILLYASFIYGPILVTKVYFIPYLVSVAWLDAVTYLHHHGYDKKLPWYRGKEWTYLRGGLSTIDRDYGIINNLHHDIGTHVVHHLCPQLPHYHLNEATQAVKPVLGKYYREPERSSGPIPFHLIDCLAKSIREDNYVSDTGDVVFYQTDPNLNGSATDERKVA